MRHHYLPEFYLKQWATDNGRLFRYRRIRNHQVDKTFEDRVAPKSVGFHDSLYGVGPITKWEKFRADHTNAFEISIMSQLDDAAAKAHATLLKGDGPLTDAQRVAWARFVLSLLHRHPLEMLRRAHFILNAGEQLRKEWLARPTSIEQRKRIRRALDGIDFPNLARTIGCRAMVEAFDEPAEVSALVRMNWLIQSATPDNPLLTTDRPVLLDGAISSGSEARPPVRVLSLAISPSRLFVGHAADDPAWATLPLEFWHQYADCHNLHLLSRPSENVFTSCRATNEVPMLGTTARLRVAIDSCLTRNAYEGTEE